MKWVGVLILFMGTASCIRQGETTAVEPKRSDTSLVQFDSAIAPIPAWDSVADSLDRVRERDSFFAIPPRKVFVSTPASFCWDQCAAFFLDTTKVYRERMKVKYEIEPVTDWKQELKANLHWYSWDNYTLCITEPDPGEYTLQKLSMNGRLLKSGAGLDTTIAGEWFLYDIDIDEEEFWRLKAGPRNFILATGFIRHCHGKGCGQLYHFIYDLDNQKAFIIDEFRGYRLNTGYNTQTGNVEFLKSDENIEEKYNCLFETGKLIVLTPEGKMQYKTNSAGKIIGYSAYLPLDEKEDKLVLYELNQ